MAEEATTLNAAGGQIACAGTAHHLKSPLTPVATAGVVQAAWAKVEMMPRAAPQ
jgi:hypothetical protein